MNRFLCVLVLVFGTAILAGAETLYFFQTVGPDTYEDGKTLVPDGEFYALVWTAKDHAFSGFNAKAELVDPVHDKLLAAVPFAQDHLLPNTSHQVSDADAGSYVGGTFSIILLDTRNADGTLSGASGSGLRKLEVVNSYKAIVAMTYTQVRQSSLLKIKTPIRIDTASLIPDGTPDPVVTSVSLREGENGREMVLKVRGTASYLRYVASGEDLKGGTYDAHSTAANGAEDEETEIEIVVPALSDRQFFRVRRK